MQDSNDNEKVLRAKYEQVRNELIDSNDKYLHLLAEAKSTALLEFELKKLQGEIEIMGRKNEQLVQMVNDSIATQTLTNIPIVAGDIQNMSSDKFKAVLKDYMCGKLELTDAGILPRKHNVQIQDDEKDEKFINELTKRFNQDKPEAFKVNLNAKEIIANSKKEKEQKGITVEELKSKSSAEFKQFMIKDLNIPESRLGF